jgi:hypothetical protein
VRGLPQFAQVREQRMVAQLGQRLPVRLFR